MQQQTAAHTLSQFWATTTTKHHFMATIQDNLCKPAPPVKSCRILLEQIFNCLADGKQQIQIREKML